MVIAKENLDLVQQQRQKLLSKLFADYVDRNKSQENPIPTIYNFLYFLTDNKRLPEQFSPSYNGEDKDPNLKLYFFHFLKNIYLLQKGKHEVEPQLSLESEEKYQQRVERFINTTKPAFLEHQDLFYSILLANLPEFSKNDSK